VVTTDNQVRKLMKEVNKHGKTGLASLKAGMDRKTGSKYIKVGKLPSELKLPRSWRTRSNPFDKHWLEISDRLKDAPELEAKTIFDHLTEQYPGQYEPGQLRSLQRRVSEWRAKEGPEQEIFFPQNHRPGEAMQTDFTWATELGITISGEPFPHMLCHPVLPYSNWEWATVCRSESLAAIKRGVQEALFRLGKLPLFHQTDNSTSATHDLKTGKRGFNEEYAAVMRHFDMKPRTTAVGKKEQNGDVEALNGALKRRMKQHLLMRGNVDFESIAEYESWVHEVIQKANLLRETKLSEELAVMRSLNVKRLPEYSEEDVGVSTWGTIRVKNNAYSVPSRLKGHRVKVRAYDDRLEVYYRDVHQLTMERLLGKNGHRINYRHIIWSLVRKPGAFLRYRYREDLFPSFTFRLAYDKLSENLVSDRQVDIEYLRILHLAASTMESDVEIALDLLLDEGVTPVASAVKAILTDEKPAIPEQKVPKVDLSEYDALLKTTDLREAAL
jgi:hypothetical protein